jgi:hypothetical protein
MVGSDKEFFAAVRTEHVADVNRLLEQGANPNATGADGMPVLFRAEVLSVARTLAEHGANIHARDRKGRTVLHEAADRVWASGAWREELDVIKYFLRMGVDPHARQRRRVRPGLHAETVLRTLPEMGCRNASAVHRGRAADSMVEESEFEPCADVSYRWFASTKELLPDGRIRLGGNWSCALRGQAKMIGLRAPAVRLEAENKDCVADRPEPVQTAADEKNVQPDGDVTLSCAAELKQTSFSTVISAEHD